MISRGARKAQTMMRETLKTCAARLLKNPEMISTVSKDVGDSFSLTKYASLWVDSVGKRSAFKEFDSTSTRQLVVTASGPDRPGIVSRLSKIILECGGNVEESRMTRLAGDFSVLMLVSVESYLPRAYEELRGRLAEIDGLQVNTRWTNDDRIKETRPRRKFRRISLRGADNPGLVYNVAEYLASSNINIENLQTSTQEAPFGGATLFTLQGVITMPLNMSTKRLIAHLDCLQTTLGVEISVANLDPAQQEQDYREWSQDILINGQSRYASASRPSSQSSAVWSIPDVSI